MRFLFHELAVNMEHSLSERKVSVISFGEISVAVFRCRGESGMAQLPVKRFLEWRKERLQICSGPFYAVLHGLSGPVTALGDARIDFCAPLKSAAFINTCGLLCKTIPAGRCALLRSACFPIALGDDISYLGGVWLLQNGEQRRSFPVFFGLEPEKSAAIDIYLPIR